MLIEAAPSAKTYAGRTAKLVGGLAVLAAAALALWHVFERLRDGLWPPHSGAGMLADLGISSPTVPWVWVQTAIDWILGWSAAGVLACLGIGLAFLGAGLTPGYDTQWRAAAAAREKLRPATAAERAARRAIAGEAAERDALEAEGEDGEDYDYDGDEDYDDDDYDHLVDDDEDYERDAAAYRRSIRFMFLRLGIVLLVLAVGLGLFIGWLYSDRIRYDRVSARIRSVSATGCLLQWPLPRNRSIWDRSEPRRSEPMRCEEARALAYRKDPRLSASVIPVATVTYSYTSPVDGRVYPGTLHVHVMDLPEDVRAGDEMIVYALKADPSHSRGPWPDD